MKTIALLILTLLFVVNGLLLIGVVFAQQEQPVIIFTPYADAAVYAEPDVNAQVLRALPAGQPVTLYTPYVGMSTSPEIDLSGDGRLYAATSTRRDEWVAVAVHGVCPRERLGDVTVVR